MDVEPGGSVHGRIAGQAPILAAFPQMLPWAPRMKCASLGLACYPPLRRHQSAPCGAGGWISQGRSERRAGPFPQERNRCRDLQPQVEPPPGPLAMLDDIEQQLPHRHRRPSAAGLLVLDSSVQAPARPPSPSGMSLLKSFSQPSDRARQASCFKDCGI